MAQKTQESSVSRVLPQVNYVLLWNLEKILRHILLQNFICTREMRRKYRWRSVPEIVLSVMKATGRMSQKVKFWSRTKQKLKF